MKAYFQVPVNYILEAIAQAKNGGAWAERTGETSVMIDGDSAAVCSAMYRIGKGGVPISVIEIEVSDNDIISVE